MTEDIQDLLGKYFNGEATAEEVSAIEKWVAAGEENKNEFKLLEKLWNKSGDQEPVSFDTEKAWQTVHTRLNPKMPVRGNPVIKRTLIGIAACLVLAMGIWWWMNDKAVAIQTVVADIDVKELMLEDGSKVYLRKGASLSFPAKFSDNSRDVSLTGQAFFEVEPNAAKPFTITAAQTSVQVVGTSFSVNTSNTRVELIVKTGRVNFSPLANPDLKKLIVAGEKGVYAGGSIEKTPNNDINFDAWQTRKLVFEGTPLSEVIRSLNDYYQVNMKLKPGSQEELASTRIIITFTNQSLESALNELSMIAPLRVQKLNETEYEVSKR